MNTKFVHVGRNLGRFSTENQTKSVRAKKGIKDGNRLTFLLILKLRHLANGQLYFYKNILLLTDL